MFGPVRRMKLPVAGRMNISRRLQPALRRKDVHPSISVDVTRADAMSEAPLRDDMFHELPVDQLKPRRRYIRPIELRQQLKRLAIVAQIHEECEFGGAAVVDLRDFPGTAALARILEPDDVVREVAELHHVDPAISIHVDCDVSEVVDIAMGVVNFPQWVLLPGGRFVPAVARDDVGFAVAIQIGYSNRLAVAGIDHLYAKRNVRGPARRG